MASVARPRPPRGVHSAIPSSGSGGPAVQCPARLVSSPSGVQPARCPAVWCPAVWCPPVGRPAGCCPPRSVRTRPSRPSSGGGGGDQVEAAGNLHHGNGSSPGGLPRLGAARWTAEQARTRAMPPRSRWSVGSVADPGQVGVGAAARDRLSDQAGPGRRAERRRWRLRGGHGSRLQREVAAAAAWLPSGLGGDHGGWWSWACRPGGRARRGRWACRRGWACGPGAAQAGSGRSRFATDSAVTCGNGWWAART
jgi:hypothetical protein